MSKRYVNESVIYLNKICRMSQTFSLICQANLNRELQRILEDRTNKIEEEEPKQMCAIKTRCSSGTTLHQSSVVRWLSLSDLLESVQKAYASFVIMLNSSEQRTRLESINLELVGKLVLFLNSWKIILSELQCSNAPSLYTVLPCINYLRTELETGEKKERGGEVSVILSSTTR
jgi:hypothetical protein